MKKGISFFIIILTYGNILLSNPIAPPWVMISELKFEEDDSWTLEIGSFYANIFKNDYDSICVETTNGFSIIRMENIADSTIVFVVTSDSLVNPLSINCEGDSVTIHSFLSSRDGNLHLTNSLIFGNYPGSVQQWNKALNQAEFKLIVDVRTKLTGFSYQPDKVYDKEGKKIYFWKRNNFMPASDMIFHYKYQ